MTDPKWDSKTTICWASILAGTTFVLTVLALGLIWWSEEPETTYEVKWTPKSARLNGDDMPVTDFWHDATNQKLIHRGRVSPERREQLLKLNLKDGDKDTPTDEDLISYRRSIDELTFKSNAARPSLGILLFLTALGGIIGVQARSICYFILHACVENDLNLKLWWPWYCLRPLLGMIFGPLVVLLIMTGLLPTQNAPQTDILTMFAFSVLVGVVASMFFDKLVQLAQTLLGLNRDDATKQPPNPPSSGSTAVTASVRWDEDSNQAVVTWTKSAAPNLDHYEVRMTPEAEYNATNATVLGNVVPGGALELRTTEGLAAPEDTASFKVYAILTTTEESGSNTVTITRP